MKNEKVCLSCGNVLQYFTHICRMKKTVSPVFGCSECDNTCQSCDHQATHYGRLDQNEKVIDLTSLFTHLGFNVITF